jgi:TonB-dependent starch-binding outer membrane protein SusC
MDRIRRWSTASVFLLVSSAGVSAQESHVFAVRENVDAYALPSLERPARLSVQSVSLERALTRLYESSGVPVTFSPSRLPSDLRVSCACESLRVSDALGILLAGTRFRYREVEGNVVVFDLPSTPSVTGGAPGVRLAAVSGMQDVIPMTQYTPIFAGTIMGRVTDSTTGRPLAGATVSLTGLQRSTLTGPNGAFTLVGVPAGVHAVQVRMIGYSQQQRNVTVASEQSVVVNFTLQAEAIALEEVVAVGYGTVRQRDVTGSVSSVRVDAVNTSLTNSVAQVLQGRVPGVQVTQASGEPGGGVSVRIRGSGSISASNSPLYVIDGLPIDNESVIPDGVVTRGAIKRNPLASLSPNDIESIEVLKDASATAIYGARGANGVILITTKSGQRAGDSQFSYDGSAGYQNVTRRLEVLSAPEYMAFLNDLRRDMGQNPEFTADQIAAVGQGTNWQDQVFRSAPVTNHHLSFSGGHETGRLYASLGVMDQQGVVIGSGTRRYSARANVDQAVGDRLRLGVNVNTSYIHDNYSPGGRSINEAAGVISASLYQDPTLLSRDESGGFPRSTLVNLDNPLGLALEAEDFSRTNRSFGTAFAEFTLLPDLLAKVNLGADRHNSRRDTYWPTTTLLGSLSNGAADVGSNSRDSYLGEFTLSFNRDIGTDHRIDVVGGTTYQDFSVLSLTARSTNFVSDAFGTNNLGAGDPVSFNPGTFRSRNQLLSYLGRVNYGFLDRYLLTATFRADGSSRFGANNRFGYFPSVGLAWRAVDEPFLRDQNLFSDLKFRVSYGVTGNQEIGNYRSLVLLGDGGRAAFNENLRQGIAPIQIANPNLKWETTRQFNAGIDFGFVANRVTGSADFFNKQTSDLLLNLPVPATTGFQTMLQNVGGVENRGFELQLNTHNLQGRVDWTTSFNIATVRNQVTELHNNVPFILMGNAGFTQDFTIIRPGDPLNSYYGYFVDGIWQTGDDIANSPQPGSRPGELRFLDVNGDGRITAADRAILGSPHPDFTFGLGNAISFGRFDLNAFLLGGMGGQMIDLNQIESENPLSFRRNRYRTEYTDRWTPSNPSNTTPSGIAPAVAYGGRVNSRAVKDASYVRVSNVELTFRMPTALTGMRSSSVYVSGQNLMTFTDYPGFDPATNAYGDSNVIGDFNTYPLARTITAGVRLGF